MASSVLIIDAEADFAHQLADTLQAAGLDTSIAADGKTGLDLAKAKVPAAIVVCVELPRMSGYSVCTKIRKDEALKTVPVIITSSGATPETFESHSRLSTRADEYLKKPFPPAMLLDVLRPHLRLGDPEPIDGEEIDIVDDEGFPQEMLSDDEAFSRDEARSMEGGYESPGRTAKLNRDDLRDDTQDGVSLGGPVGISADPIDEDEAMTTVGRLEDVMGPPSSAPPPRGAAAGAEDKKKIDQLRAELNRLQDALADAERAKNDAVAQMELMQRPQSSIGSAAPASREVLELKRDRNTKEKEILALKERLNEKEKELIAWRDKEAEFEEEIVKLQEAIEQTEQAKAAVEAKAAADQRTAQSTQADLKRRLNESSSREADLDATVQALTQELAQLKEYVSERERSEASLRGDMDALQRAHEQLRADHQSLDEKFGKTSQSLSQTTDALRRTQEELSQTANELERVSAEADQTARALESTQRDLASAQEEIARLTQEVANATAEADRQRAEADANAAEIERLSDAYRKKSGEHDRTINELSAATAEAQSLRENVRAKEADINELHAKIAELESQLDAERAERDGLRGLIEEISAERERADTQLNNAYEKMRDDEAIRGKALQALEIALALLKEAGFANAEAVESIEARG